MKTPTENLEEAAGLIHDAQQLLKHTHPHLADACQVMLEEIDAEIDAEVERDAHED